MKRLLLNCIQNTCPKKSGGKFTNSSFTAIFPGVSPSGDFMSFVTYFYPDGTFYNLCVFLVIGKTERLRAEDALLNVPSGCCQVCMMGPVL